jgi:CBS domain-containing protein/anti-sigma regulatory factor (Ser/Thr protein kinase)
MKRVESYMQKGSWGVPNMNPKDSGLPSKVQELAWEVKIQEAMSQDVITVAATDTMSEVRKQLFDNRISGLPVVDHEHLIGVISIDNLITCMADGEMDKTVGDNMTVGVVSLYHDEPLIHAIRKFEKLQYGRLPVVDRDTGKLVGILTKGDIITCLLKKLEVNYYEEQTHKYRGSHIFEDIHADKMSLMLRHKITGKNYKHAGEQSGCLKKNLLKLGIPTPVVRRITVASCEAEMNIIIFTEGGEITACVEEDKITVNAIDNGPGIPDIAKAMQPGYSTAPDWVRDMGFGAGMGLPNIKNCSDEMKIDSKPGKGTNLEFVVFLEQ